MASEKKDDKNNAEIEELKKKFNTKKFTMDEVKKHENEESPWVIIYGGVYDMTEFQLDHPGGPDVLQDIAGQGMLCVNMIHNKRIQKKLVNINNEQTQPRNLRIYYTQKKQEKWVINI